MIEVRTYPQEETRSPSKGCYWTAECTLQDGRQLTARFRNGVANELARLLIEVGIPDDEMQTYDQRGLKALHYRSFHEAAKWSYTEGNVVLHRQRYMSPEEIKSALTQNAQKRHISRPGGSE